MNLEKLIGQVISLRENDLLISKHYFEEFGNTEEWDYEEVDFAFDLLQSALTRLLIGHTYCSNPDCSCSAKRQVERVVRSYDSVFKRELYQDQYVYLTEELIEEDK